MILRKTLMTLCWSPLHVKHAQLNIFLISHCTMGSTGSDIHPLLSLIPLEQQHYTSPVRGVIQFLISIQCGAWEQLSLREVQKAIIVVCMARHADQWALKPVWPALPSPTICNLISSCSEMGNRCRSGPGPGKPAYN